MRMISSLLLFCCLFSTSAQAEYLCSANSEQYPQMKDGVVFSKSVPQLGAQGTPSGHVLLHEDEHYAYRLVAGTRMQIGNQPARLLDFYVELHNKSTGTITRAKSGQADEPQTAQLELIDYPADSLLYRGILLFSCKLYSF